MLGTRRRHSKHQQVFLTSFSMLSDMIPVYDSLKDPRHCAADKKIVHFQKLRVHCMMYHLTTMWNVWAEMLKNNDPMSMYVNWYVNYVNWYVNWYVNMSIDMSIISIDIYWHIYWHMKTVILRPGALMTIISRWALPPSHDFPATVKCVKNHKTLAKHYNDNDVSIKYSPKMLWRRRRNRKSIRS